MGVTKRRYNMLTDFQRVHDFLTETYHRETLNSYLLPQYFEYAHHLQWFDFQRAHRFGIWEEDGRLVGIACYEMQMGDVHLHTREKYAQLLPELLTWAEQKLSLAEAGKQVIKVWVTDKEPAKQALLRVSGYTLMHTEPVKIFDYKNPFVQRALPDGFSITDGTNVDVQKLADCWWAGFDHGEPPAPLENYEGILKMLGAPRSNHALMTIAVAPNGEYACALGMWFDEQNQYAYLEPLATLPQYRRMGLATICLTHAMEKTKAMGAQYCFGGGREFYTAIGFDHPCNRELWKKEF